MSDIIVVGHQPQYLPYLGILNKISKADVYIIVDHVQYVRKYFHNRTYIKAGDEPLMLTVPVLSKGELFAPIMDIRVNRASDWARKHLKSIRLAYAKAPHFDRYYPEIEEILQRPTEMLVDVTSALLLYIIREFDLVSDVRMSSQLGITGAKTDLLVALTRAVGGTVYVSGEGARDYFDPAAFAQSGLVHRFNEFHHPRYPQSGKGFLEGMAAIDLLFHCGKDGRKYIVSPEEYPV